MTAVDPDVTPARTQPADVLPEDRLLWEFWLNHGLVAESLRERLEGLPAGSNGAYLAGNALYGGFEHKLLDALSSSAGLDPAVVAAVDEALAPPAAKVTLEDSEGRLLALLALWPPPGGDLARKAREEAERVSRWWDLARAAGRTNLLAAVAAGIGSAGIAEAVPAPVLRFLQGAAEGIRRRNERLLPFVEKVTQELSDAGVRHCLLKESALLREIYTEPGERLVGDVDLLLSSADIERTEAVLRAMDHRPFVGIWSSTWYRAHHHHVAPLVSPDAATKVEPHTGIWIPGESGISISEEILATSRPHPGFAAQRPDATILCFHLLADLHGGASAGKLGQAADLMRLLRAEGREVDTGRLVSLAERTGCRPYIEDSVAMVARVFGRDLLDERAPMLVRSLGEAGGVEMTRRLRRRVEVSCLFGFEPRSSLVSFATVKLLHRSLMRPGGNLARAWDLVLSLLGLRHGKKGAGEIARMSRGGAPRRFLRLLGFPFRAAARAMGTGRRSR